jgi:3-deoxy-manno-octulosonate cytidylyltransferase (CMP-KDO synthetase)
MSEPIVVIPARMASVRLPDKPMAVIAGRPMILHVLERAQLAAIGPVAVACCDTEVFDVVTACGGLAIMTDPALPSGSDRVHAALAELDPAGYHEIVVNLQGDLPVIDPADIAAVLEPLRLPSFDIGTLVAPLRPEDAAGESTAKAACAFAPGHTVARALYFSRSVIPWGPGPLWHHIGVYAWRRDAIARYVATPPSQLEAREKLEQLRALEAGLAIGCAAIAASPMEVNTPEDLALVRSRAGA